MSWIDALPLTELDAKGKAVIRHDGRQILVLRCRDGIFAFPNRCPHEGYPLSEGALGDGCVLTCNWHNWKFDLATGQTLVGGDRLELFPVRIEGQRVLLEITPPDPAVRRTQILANVEAALEDADNQRLVRETARLVKLGSDPVDAVRVAIDWAADRLEFGTTHAIAGAPDWLALHDAAPEGSAERLAAIGEILGHLADDSLLGRGRFPFPAGIASWDAGRFTAAIEREDEAAAAALVRGALRDGLTVDDLAPVLAEAALAHYADFGHSLIYAVKTAALARRVGPGSAETLLLMLARSLVYATREDLLPEFRDYAARLRSWGESTADPPPPDAALLRRAGPKAAMALVAGWGAAFPPERIFEVLIEAASWTMLHVDDRALTRTDAKLADNIGWLDFTHALTFAEAAERALARRPDLWPNVLLQLACFVGRNAAYADLEFDAGPHRVADIPGFLDAAVALLFDHGRDEFIVSVHLAKTLLAARALIGDHPRLAPIVAAALHRFLNAPMKRRHVLRTAVQMRDLVAEE
jgi:nitrite reductase/ring-hydroxylating ferredoxin subunit